VSLLASCLQTLSHSQAIAFTDSLQVVKAHLQTELEQMRVLFQQKKQQLETIDAILSEAVSIGLVDEHSIEAQTLTSDEANDINGSSKITNGELTTEADFADAPDRTKPETTTPHPKHDRSKQPRSQPKRGTRTTNETSEEKGRKSAEGRTLNQFLNPEFRTNGLVASIAQILTNSPEPLEIETIVATLYGSLPSSDYIRAKRSVTNILSQGKSKGNWQSVGRGLYTAYTG